MKNKILFTALVLMCLIGSISTALASQETRLNIAFNMELTETSIYGNYISWGENGGDSTNIYDLTTGNEKQINSDRATSAASIYGKNAVFSQGDPEYVELYNIHTGLSTKLVYDSDYVIYPAIYDNVVTYQKESNGEHNVYMYNLLTKIETQITTSGTAWDPEIYENNIVYMDNSNIYIYNIVTKKQSLIGSGNNQNIYGNVVVWANNGNIYMRNIVTHKITQITKNGTFRDPAIYGNNIVYETDLYSGNKYYNIYLYGISTGKTTQITKSNCALCPAIYGNKIVYIDFRNANTQNIDTENLFVYDLTAKLAKPTGTIAANVTSGTHPLTVFFSYTEDGDMATSYLWNFGDGITSTNPWTATHIYNKKGTYTVSLKVSNSAGSNTVTKTKYITVN